MKNKLLLIIFLIIGVGPILSKAQCVVTKEVLDDGGISYTGVNVHIYKNEDLENGLQSAYLQMIVLQKEKSSNLLQFVFTVSIYSTGGKAEVSPSSLEFTFVDGQVLKFSVYQSHPSALTKIGGYTYKTNIGSFQFKMSDYLVFQKTNVATIKIIDSETNGSLIITPKSDVVLKQANCIAEAIN